MLKYITVCEFLVFQRTRRWSFKAMQRICRNKPKEPMNVTVVVSDCAHLVGYNLDLHSHRGS